jgi:phosphonopyruvate decarboxylase
MSEVADRLLEALQRHGYVCFSGVPCSLLKGLFRRLDAALEGDGSPFFYVPAVREDSALGVAAGMYLGGRKSTVLMQNSGLGYSMNVLTSLNLIYEIPVLLVIGWRGAYGNDAVEHEVIGKSLPALLSSIHLPYVVFDSNRVEDSVAACIHHMEDLGRPAALLIRDAL